MTFVPITLAQAKSLAYHTTLYHRTHRNDDKTALRVRVNGQVKTWKTRPGQVQVPIKHGMYDFSYITERTLGDWSFTDPTTQETN